MRYIPLKDRPAIKEGLQRLANRRNVSKKLRLLVVADLTRQLERLDQAARGYIKKVAKPTTKPAAKRQPTRHRGDIK